MRCAANAALLDELSALSLGESRRVRSAAEPGSTVRSRPNTVARPLVLEGQPGTTLIGAFAVQNVRSIRVDAAAGVEPFVDATGRVVPVVSHFEPDRITLEPDAETVVRLHVRIPADAVVNSDLTSAITVPGLSDMVIPVALCVRRGAV